MPRSQAAVAAHSLQGQLTWLQLRPPRQVQQGVIIQRGRKGMVGKARDPPSSAHGQPLARFGGLFSASIFVSVHHGHGEGTEALWCCIVTVLRIEQRPCEAVKLLVYTAFQSVLFQDMSLSDSQSALCKSSQHLRIEYEFRLRGTQDTDGTVYPVWRPAIAYS